MKIIYLKPRSGYATPLRSDTLWGLLCWGIRYLWGQDELKAMLNDCAAGKPPFVISSTFPCKKYGKDWLPFFPNPLPYSPPQPSNKKEAKKVVDLRKKYKDVFSFLCLDDFNAVLAGSPVVDELYARLSKIYDEEEEAREEAKRTGRQKKERTILPKEILQTAPKLEDFSMTHNTIDRLRGGTLSIGDGDDAAGQLFHSGEFYWADPLADPNQGPNTGIFFLADGPDTSKLEAVLHLFSHLGIGADRSAGKGFFEVEIQGDFNFNLPQQPNALLNLSLYRPTPDELKQFDELNNTGGKSNFFHYLTEIRAGYVSTDTAFLRKNATRYFQEASVFPLLNAQTDKICHLGRIFKQEFEKEKAPPHDVYVNGFGLMVPLIWKN